MLPQMNHLKYHVLGKNFCHILIILNYAIYVVFKSYWIPLIFHIFWKRF